MDLYAGFPGNEAAEDRAGEAAHRTTAPRRAPPRCRPDGRRAGRRHTGTGRPARARAAIARRAPALPALITLAVVFWRIQVPSYWRDEAATLSAAHRSFPGLLRMLGHVDAVHGAYYLLMWAVVRLGGSGELATRLPSALAMAAAAGVVTALGRRMVSLPAGLAAGLVVAALAPVSWFGQDARPFAVETALACVASYLLVAALGAPAGHPRRRWLCAYGVAVAVLGVTDLFGLLLVPAHAITLVFSRRRGPGRDLAPGWLAAVTGAGVVVSPFALLDWAQRNQLDWLRPPDLAALVSVGRLAGSPGLDLGIAALLGCALVISALRGRLRLDWPGWLPALCLPWLLLPPAVLLAVSVLWPVYTFRYIVFCIPAAALLAGAALAAVGRVAGAAALVLIVVMGLPAQMGERGPAGHGDGIRQLDRVLAAWELPGDAVLYQGGAGMRSLASAYPYGLARLHEIGLGESPVRAGTLSGTDAPPSTVAGRLGRVSRVWVVEPGILRPVPGLHGTAFRLVRTWHVTDIWLRLYAKTTMVSSGAQPPRASW